MNRLSLRLILLIVAALIPAFLLQLGTEVHEFELRHEAGNREVVRLARMVSDQQREIADAALQVLTAWSGFAAELRGRGEFCHDQAARFLALSARYQELTILDTEGRVACGAGAGPLRDRPVVQPAVQVSSGAATLPPVPYVVGASAGNLSAGRQLMFTAPFSDGLGQRGGTVALGLRLDWLQERLAQIVLPRDSVMCLIDRNGAVLAHVLGPTDAAGRVWAPKIGHLVARPQAGVMDVTGPDGIARVVAHQPLLSQTEGLTLVIGLPRERLFEDLDAAQGRATASLLAGAILAVSGAVFGANRFLRRPFLRLLGVAERMRQGDLTARAGMAPDGSELARLGTALDATAAALAAREGALRDALATAELTRLALGESETRLRLALDSAEVCVWEMDLRHRRLWLDHRAEDLSRGLLPANRWIGLQDPALRRWLDTIHPADWDGRAEGLRAAMAGRRDHYATEYRFRDPDGVWRWVAERGAVVSRDRDNGTALRIIGISRDVTEQRDAAAALQREVADRTDALAESESRFRSIFDATYQFTALAAPDGTLLEANRALLEFCGRRAEELRGRKLWQALAGDADPAVAARLQDETARAASGRFVRWEMELPGAGSRQAVVDFSLKPVFGPGGAVALLVAEARDITERSRLQVQLAQAQKMEAVGQLTGGVAHDFNNLLQAVTGNLDLITRTAEMRGDTRLQRLVANAQRAVQRGARLTQQLLAFSRRQNLRPELVLVSRLTAETLELLRRAAGEMVKVSTDAEAALWPCHIDPAQFESALLNLVLNARDAMPHGGRIDIRARNATLGAAAAALDIPEGDYVRVDVADNGSGIAPEHLPRIFEPFFTTKEVGKGSGLGLAMVHGFARQSGGTVAIDTELGRGTTITMYLPRGSEDTQGDAAAASRAEPGQPPLPASLTVLPRVDQGRDAPTVLLVEDNPEVLDAMQFALVDAGYRLLTARDGAEALDVLTCEETRIDVLLCDLMLPGPNSGDEIADLALAQRPGLRVLLISGYAGEAMAQRGRDDADFEVLAKPFAQRELLRRLAELTLPAA
jgi:PAS domain S-box-containing protein